MAERLLSRKYVVIFDRRLSLSRSLPPSSETNDKGLHQSTSARPQADPLTQRQSPLKPTIRHEADTTRFDLSTTQTPPDKTQDVAADDSRGESYPLAPEGSDADDEVLGRCVFIENVPCEMCSFLEVVIESSNSGGGTVELFEPDPTRGGVLVCFVDQHGLHISLLVCLLSCY